MVSNSSLPDKEDSSTVHPDELWKKIEIGTFKSSRDLLQELFKKKIDVGYSVQDFLDPPDSTNLTLSNKRKEISLVLKSVSDLGFEKSVSRRKVYNKALKLGLKLCNPEIGPLLRLQYMDQPKEEKLFIAMNSLKAFEDSSCIFSLKHQGQPFQDLFDRVSIDLISLRADDICDPRRLFVFCI